MVPGWPYPGCPQQVGDRLQQQLQPRAGHNTRAQCSSPHPSAPQPPHSPSQRLPALPQKRRDKRAPAERCSPNLCSGLVPRGSAGCVQCLPLVLASATPEFRFLFLFPLCRHTTPSLEQTQLHSSAGAQTFTSPERNRPHADVSLGPLPLAAPQRSRALGCREEPSAGHLGSQAGLLTHRASLHSPASRRHNPANSKTPHNPISAAPKPLRSRHASSSHRFPKAARCSNTSQQMCVTQNKPAAIHSHPGEKGNADRIQPPLFNASAAPGLQTAPRYRRPGLPRGFIPTGKSHPSGQEKLLSTEQPGSK